MRVPFKIYADFEAFTEPLDTCQPNPSKSYIQPYQKHIPFSFCYFVKCYDDKNLSSEDSHFHKKRAMTLLR